MKKKILIVLAMILVFICSMLFVNAEDVSFSMTGKGSIYRDEVLTVTVKINGSNINQIKGTITYNNEQLKLEKITSLIPETWTYTPDEGDTADGDFDFGFADETTENPIDGETGLLSLEFSILDVPENTEVSVVLKYLSVTVNSEEEITEFEEVIFKSKVLRRLSDNNFLKELNITNATITPNFDKEIMSYTASVPYSVSKLQFTALTEDLNASMKVENPDLVPNAKTNVTITVTSESNKQRVYTIQVTRAQDPNYVKSSNNKLSAINVGYGLSPSFNPDVTEYSMEIPYEKTSVSISASTQDSKASYKVEGGNNLSVGNNIVKITCTAENGTTKVYTLTVKRLPAEGTPTEEPTSEPTNEPTASPESTPDVTGEPTATPEKTAATTAEPHVIVVSDPRGMPYVFVIILVILFFGIGFIFGMSVNVRRNDSEKYPDSGILETDFGGKEKPKKDDNMIFIVEDNLRDDDK